MHGTFVSCLQCRIFSQMHQVPAFFLLEIHLTNIFGNFLQMKKDARPGRLVRATLCHVTLIFLTSRRLSIVRCYSHADIDRFTRGHARVFPRPRLYRLIQKNDLCCIRKRNNGEWKGKKASRHMLILFVSSSYETVVRLN